jgi:Mg-chelatase subunit ChlD
MSDKRKVKVDKVDQPQLAKHDSAVLDLAFAMDCTGSMGSYIRTAQQNIRQIVEQIVASEKSDVHLALVEYRDHPPQDSTFVTRTHDFTGSVGTMKTWLDACSAQGGGDTPEAVADALHDVLKLSWRDEATKICVMISDAPPHGLSDSGDGFPNGCPSGIDPMEVARQLAEKGITIYMVGCEPSITPYKDFFTAIAYLTGGQYVPLTSAQLLTQVIIGGAQEELSLQQFMAQVEAEVRTELHVSTNLS